MLPQGDTMHVCRFRDWRCLCCPLSLVVPWVGCKHRGWGDGSWHTRKGGLFFRKEVGFAPGFKASEQSCCSCAEDDDGMCSTVPCPPAAEYGVRTRGHPDSRQVMNWRVVPPAQHGKSGSVLYGMVAWSSPGVREAPLRCDCAKSLWL